MHTEYFKPIYELDLLKILSNKKSLQVLVDNNLLGFQSTGVSSAIKGDIKNFELTHYSFRKIKRKFKEKTWNQKRDIAHKILKSAILESMLPNLIMVFPCPKPIAISICTTIFILIHFYNNVAIDKLSFCEALILSELSEMDRTVDDLIVCIESLKTNKAKDCLKELDNKLNMLVQKGIISQKSLSERRMVVFTDKFVV